MSCHSIQKYQQCLEKQKLNKDRRLEHHVLPFRSRSKDYGHCFDPCFTTYVLSILQYKMIPLVEYSKKREIVQQFLTCFLCAPWKNLYISYFHIKVHGTTIQWLCAKRSWRDDLLGKCIRSKDAYSSYHYQCIERQMGHTQN